MPGQESLNETFEKGFKEIELHAEKSGGMAGSTTYKIFFLQELEKRMQDDNKLNFNYLEIVDMADETTNKFNRLLSWSITINIIKKTLGE